jgi:hypothetical protein
MTPASKMDFKKIQDSIRSLGRDDIRTRLTTKVGDNPANVDAVLTLIESLCSVIRQQEGLSNETKILVAVPDRSVSGSAG